MDFDIHRELAKGFGPTINRDKRTKPHTALLVVTKALLTLAIFFYYNILKFISFAQFLFYVKLFSAVFLVLLQQPVSKRKQLSRTEVKELAIFSVLSLIINLLWMESLVICGPVRAILLSYQSDIALIAICKRVFSHKTGNSLASDRGVCCFVVGLLCLLLLDKDATDDQHNVSSVSLAHVYHHSVEVFAWLGLPDHKGGMLLLLITSFLHALLNAYGKNMAVKISGFKRFKALTTCGEFIFLTPLFLISYFKQTEAVSLWSFRYEVGFIIVVVSLLNFHVDSISFNQVYKFTSSRLGSCVLFISAVMIGLFWEHCYDTEFKHKISSGVIFATLCFIAATRLLVQPPPINASKRTFIGYSTSGTPLYSYADELSISKSFFMKLRQYFKDVINSPESRSIFFYLCLNLTFTAVELLYGMWTNSLGLISDGFHMLFDCSALVLGLWAALASKWSATKMFSYGYGRIEVLSGFVNGLFLVVIAAAVFLAAVQRLYDPPHVHTENLLAISVLGLLVNLVGISAFSHVHTHGGGSGGCDHGHTHHEHSSHGHGHNKQHNHSNKKPNTNMQGVFLHVLADTLGSVGVIISTLLIKYYGLNIADPICSLFIAVMIIGSVVPLLKSSSLILLQRTPQELVAPITDAIIEIKGMNGVLTCRQIHIWQHTQDIICGCLVVQIDSNASEHKIRQQVFSILKARTISRITVQIEKQSFHDHMSKLTTGHYTEICFTRTTGMTTL